MPDLNEVLLAKQEQGFHYAKELAHQFGVRKLEFHRLTSQHHYWSLAVFHDREGAEKFKEHLVDEGFQARLVTWDNAIHHPYVKFRCGEKLVGKLYAGMP